MSKKKRPPGKRVRDNVNQENWKKFLEKFEKEHEKKSVRVGNSYGLSHK